MKDYEENRIVKTKLPCLSEDCDSSDARALREDGSSFCFSCSTSFPPPINKGTREIERNTMVNNSFDNIQTVNVDDILGYKSYPISSRKISLEVVDHFGVKMETSSEGGASAHLYPYTKDGKLVAYKKRILPKDFSVIGNFKDVDLFGQSKAQGGRQLVITEGEIDAMSVSQAYKEYKNGTLWPVVGLPSASAKSAVLAQREWLNSFEKVIIMVDQDDAGKSIAEYLCKILRFGKAYIATLPEKDANETLQKHGGQAIINATWNAREWSPAGIVKGESIWEQFEARQDIQSIPYPECLSGLNTKLKGIRHGEITLFTSGTGSGKSTVIKEIILDLLQKQDDNIGLISLEESIGDTAEKFIQMELQHNLSAGPADKDKLRKAYEKVFADERLILLDHQGSVGDDSLIDKIEHLCQMGCKYLVLDHITIAVSEGSEGRTGNEAVDKMMSDLLKVVKRYNVWLGLISHLRKAPGGGSSFEEGKLASIDDIKGSGSIKQISFDIISFARNMVADTEDERNTIQFRVLKSRFTGLTGSSGSAYYNHETCRLKCKDAGITDFDVVPKAPVDDLSDIPF